MKWLGLLLPFALRYFNQPQSRSPQKSLKESAIEIFDTLTFRSRKVAFLAIGALAGITILCGTFFMFVIEATRQYDFSGVILWNSTLTVSAVLFAVMLAGLTYVYAAAWPGARTELKAESRRLEKQRQRWDAEQRDHSRQPSQIEQALSLYVLDLVEERQQKRKIRYANRAAQHSANVAMNDYSSRRESLSQESIAKPFAGTERKPDFFH